MLRRKGRNNFQGFCRFSGHTVRGGIRLEKTTDFRLEPEKRLCPKFDETSIALFPVAKPGEMGVRVVDNCAEEHMM